MHAQLDAPGRAPRDAQQLDAVAQFLGVADVLPGELRDAFGVGTVELHRDAEADRRDDGELVRGIDAFDVEGRIGLRVAQALRLLEHLVEARALVAHLREDEVAGAVDDAGDPLDAVGGEPFAHRLDDRDAAGHRRLERHHHALAAGGGEDLVAVRGQQRLVGRHHVLAVLDRGQDQVLGDGVAADQLDHDVDVGIAHHREGVVGQPCCIPDDGARPREILVCDDGDLDAAAGTPGDLALVAIEDAERAAADRADAQQADVDGSHGSCFSEHEGGNDVPLAKIEPMRARAMGAGIQVDAVAAAGARQALEEAEQRMPHAARAVGLVGDQVVDVEALARVRVLVGPEHRYAHDGLVDHRDAHLAARREDLPHPAHVVRRQIRAQLPMHRLQPAPAAPARRSRRSSSVMRTISMRPARGARRAWRPARRRRLQQPVLAEHLLDPAQRLARPGFVLDQREAHVVVAILAEADARRHRAPWRPPAASWRTPGNPGAA